MAYGNNTEEEASEKEPEEEVWVGDDLDSEEYGEVEVLEDGTRVADEWVGVDFEGGTETADLQKAGEIAATSSEVVTSTGDLSPDTTSPSTGSQPISPTPKTGGQVLPFPVPPSTGHPVLVTAANPFSGWNFGKGKPPWPEGWELSPKGERKIGRKTFVGYQYLWVVKCPDCGCRVQRKTGRHFSPTAVAKLLEKSLETQQRLVQLRLATKARQIAFHRRCSQCSTGIGRPASETANQ